MPTLYRVTLPVSKLAQAVSFYRSLLGEPGLALGEGWHSFDYGGATLLLRESRDLAMHREPIYLAVDEPLVQVHYRAQGLGAQGVADIGMLPSGEQGFLVADPFGNMIYVVDTRSVPWHLHRAGGAGVQKGGAKAAAPVAAEATTLNMQRDFLGAVKGGDLQAVQDMLMLDPDLATTTDAAGVSVLMLAGYKQQKAVVDYLLSLNPELNIWEAAAVGRVDRVTQLLEAGQPATQHSVDGFTPLGLACFFGHPPCVRLLLAKGADPNMPAKNEMKVRPIHSALARAPEEAVLLNLRALLAAKADVNGEQQGGYTALHQAADRGFESVVKLLLGAGARNARAANGKSPADLARAKGHTALVALLL